MAKVRVTLFDFPTRFLFVVRDPTREVVAGQEHHCLLKKVTFCCNILRFYSRSASCMSVGWSMTIDLLISQR